MARFTEKIRRQRGAIGADEARRLFRSVDETGHADAAKASAERELRAEKGHGVSVDPLSGDDPSGSDVEKVITRTTVTLMLVMLAGIILTQVAFGVVRRANTTILADDASRETVGAALSGGVEWGNGFTQFPADSTIQEADQSTHRIEVTVLDITSGDALTCFSNAQIQATALSVNALLNPDIDTVIYHVNVYDDGHGGFRTSHLLGFLRPTGESRAFVTFVWRKSTTISGEVAFACEVTGMDEETQDMLHGAITSAHTPLYPSTMSGRHGTEDENAETAASDGNANGEADGGADARDGANGEAGARDSRNGEVGE